MTTQDLRDLFVSYFVDRGHMLQPSAPLVLADDASSLFTSAGMQPYMAVFRGETEPPASRVVSIQKCQRTGDLEGVGVHNRYCTFFEMLGNFSFGDYFKQDAIEWAWEFITEVVGLPKEHLYVTAYLDDDETEEIWHKRMGVPMSHISRLGRSDNWWPKDQWEGPCGPCSEIHLDLGPEYGCDREDCAVGCDCDRYLEIWNLVFQMYTEAPDGTLTPLPKRGIDTGMGLERLAIATQGAKYVAETNEMAHIMRKAASVISEQTGDEYHYGDDARSDLALRIITDHVRAAAFTQAGGVAPSNEGAGYVLRRFIRRAYRFGRQLGATEPFLYKVIPAVTEAMGQAYPELVEKEAFSQNLVKREEERFSSTLRQGMSMFEEIAFELQQQKATVIPGEKAFTMYDTFGFPVEMTEEMALERGLSVDMAGFKAAMEAQRIRSGAGGGGLAEVQQELSLKHLPATKFVGYDMLSSGAKVLTILQGTAEVKIARAGEDAALILDKTPFYAEQGGQMGDHGLIQTSDFEFTVTNTVKHGDKFLHEGSVVRGSVSVGAEVTASVNHGRRNSIQRNHTGTHLLQAALREVVGGHVAQSGSLVSPERLRFDFTHHEAVTREQLLEVERLCNEWILDDRTVTVEEMSYDEAIEKGATALFTEKYGQHVRTVGADGISMELCGGTHVERTGQIGSLHILGESSVAAGIRRIEAVTGIGAAEHHRELDERLMAAAEELQCAPNDIIGRVEQLRQQIKALQSEVKQAQSMQASGGLSDLVASAVEIAGVKLVVGEIADADPKILGNMADEMVSRLADSVVLLGTAKGNKAPMICKASDGAIAAGVHAGNLLRAVIQLCGGGGAGGRDEFAQGAANDASKLAEALGGAAEILKGMLAG